MADNNSLADQATISQTASMASFDNNSDSDSESEYFEARGYFEDTDDSDSDDVFYEARTTFDDEADSTDKELLESSNTQHQEASERLEDKKNSTSNADIPAAATNSVLAEKRKIDDVTKEDQETDDKSPIASSSSCVASPNSPKKLKPAIVFGQSSGFGYMKNPQATTATVNTAPTVTSFAATKPYIFGAMNVPQVASAFGSTAPIVTSFATNKPFTFGAPTADNNTLFNKESTNLPDDSNKENDNVNVGVKPSIFGEAPRETLAAVKETEVTTGEEDEETICQSKAKLYVMDADQSWKDYGVGTFRLNMDNNSGSRRLVMRADIVHRLMLNQKLFPEMKVFIMQEKFIRFGTFETKTNEAGETETKLVNYAIKVASATAAQELCQQINLYIPKNKLRKRKVSNALDNDEQPSSPQPDAGRPLSQKKQKNL